MCLFIAAEEFNLANNVSLRRVIEVIDAVGDDFPPQIDLIFLLVRVLIPELIDVEMQLASVGHDQCALIIDNGKRGNLLLPMLILDVAWDGHYRSNHIVNDFPDFSLVSTNRDHEVAILRQGKARDPILVLVLDA